MNLDFYLLLPLMWAGAGSRSRNFDIPAPAPAKSSGSLRLRLHNTSFKTKYLPVSFAFGIVLRSRNFVSAPAPTFKKFPPGSDYSFATTCLHIFILKSGFFKCFLWKNIDLIHLIYPIQYELWFLYTNLAYLEPGAGAEISIYRLRLQPKVLAPCGSGSTTLLWDI